jgi:hypothetical protein
MHPDLAKPFEALEQQRKALFDELQRQPQEALQHRTGADKWSALQHLRHLELAEAASLRYLRKKLEHTDGIAPAGWGGRMRSLLLRSWFLLGRKAKAPKALGDPPPGEDPQAVMEDFARLRAEWANQLEAIPEDLVSKALFRHQIAGRMSLPDALRFFHTHFHHHEKGMRRVLEAAR